MSNADKYLLFAVGTVLVLFGVMANNNVFETAFNYLKNFEGFRSSPYWDVSRYSWGYGTKAPGPTGTISREKAKADAIAFMQNDYNYLKPMLRVELTPNQWAALLCFSYNLGKGNADNLVPNINAQNWDALRDQWLKYIYVDGLPDPDILARRRAEWRIFEGTA